MRSVILTSLIMLIGAVLTVFLVNRSEFRRSQDRGNAPFPGQLQTSQIQSSPADRLSIDATAASSVAVSGIQPKWAKLQHTMRTDGDDLFIELHPDGSRSISLDGRFTHFSAAVRLTSGEMAVQCFSGYTQLEAAVTGRRPAKEPAKPHSHELVAY